MKRIIGIIAVLIVGIGPLSAQAATLFLAPAQGNYRVGQTFTITLRTNSADQAANAMQGTLSFDPTILRVQSISTVGSIFTLNIEPPNFSNANGTVTFAGVIVNPGYQGSGGNIATVTFAAIAPGSGTISFSSGSILANDGQGTELLATTAGSRYVVAVATTPAPSGTPVPTGGIPLPVVTSPTHPDQNAWYSDPNPVFTWTLPAGVDNTSHLVNPKPDANPGNQPDGLHTSAELKNGADGTSYFHIKFRSHGVWGPTAHFRYNIDTRPPEPFSITRVDDGTTSQPRLVFATTDATSGVAQYLMRIDDGEWFEVSAGSTEEPFILPQQKGGTHLVTVQAVDAAGNVTEATIELTVPVSVWWLGPLSALRDFWSAEVMMLILGTLAFAWLISTLVKYFRRAPHGLPSLKLHKGALVSDLLALDKDIKDELELLKRLAAQLPIDSEHRHLRKKLLECRKAIRILTSDTHNRLVKK